MDYELWFRLRRIQMHPLHLAYRPLLLSLLEDSPGDWGEFLARARDRDCPAAELEADAPEDEGIARDEASRLSKRGVRLLTPADSDYPAGFRRSIDPPLTVTMLGDPDCLARPALAVVGSREPCGETLSWLERELGAFARATRATVVSGGARGVDQRAHSVALRNGSPTVVLLPSGIEVPYPADFERWFKPIVEAGGAIVSEYPGRMDMRKQHFHQRNRLIEAAGTLTLVVEARLRSGTLITAARAAEIGRPLLVVPGHPSDPRFGGSLQLLAEGATMVRQSEDLTLFWQAEQVPEDPLSLAVDQTALVYNQM